MSIHTLLTMLTNTKNIYRIQLSEVAKVEFFILILVFSPQYVYPI